jgi:hypothetical protein
VSAAKDSPTVSGITAEVKGRVQASPREVFDFFREVDVTRILTGRGPLPAVRAVNNPSERWNEVGQERTFELADGSSLRERMTEVVAPKTFAYEIDEITGPLRRLVSTFSGRWSFSSEPADGEGEATLAHWHYVFTPHSRWTRPPTFVIVRALWQPYMGQVLRRTAELAHQEFGVV